MSVSKTWRASSRDAGPRPGATSSAETGTVDTIDEVFIDEPIVEVWLTVAFGGWIGLPIKWRQWALQSGLGRVVAVQRSLQSR